MRTFFLLFLVQTVFAFNPERILVVGTGYVGLVTGACLAEMGHNVICLDIDEKKIADLKNGIIPFYEPSLKELVLSNKEKGRLSFTTSYEEGVNNSRICFLAVPTPSNQDGACDLSYVESATKKIARVMNGYRIIVDKSTVPVGTGKKVREWIKDILDKRGSNALFEVVSNPEFLKEGAAVQDCLHPDRIVIGVDNDHVKKIMHNLYEPLHMDERILEMEITSAELTKYAANAMLASRISLMNEIANIASAYGANIHEVRKGIGSDSRIGAAFLNAGVGYGGSCFPKDIKALCHMAKSKEVPSELLNAIDSVNYRQKTVLSRYVMEYFGSVKGKTIAVLGLSFKPETDDMREAPSLVFIEKLQKEGALLRLFDPVAKKNAKALISQENVTFCDSELEAINGADAIALITEWKQFKQLDFTYLRSVMRGHVLFDGRNLFNADEISKKGFDYIGIGIRREKQ